MNINSPENDLYMNEHKFIPTYTNYFVIKMLTEKERLYEKMSNSYNLKMSKSKTFIEMVSLKD